MNARTMQRGGAALASRKEAAAPGARRRAPVRASALKRQAGSSSSSNSNTSSTSPPTPLLRASRGVAARAVASGSMEDHAAAHPSKLSQLGLVGLAVMGQNLALNVASKGFSISVYNRSYAKTEQCVKRAAKEDLAANLTGYDDLEAFVQSLERPRNVVLLVKAGAPVDGTIESLLTYLEPGDAIIDGGNEWYQNTEMRQKKVLEEKGILYMGMGVSGGEEGARNGPSMMPGGNKDVWDRVKPVLSKVAAQVDDGPCVTYIGKGGSGNFVKMVHNGIEYGDMQLIAEAYDVLKTLGGLTNAELEACFSEWNKGELESFLVETSATIFAKKDDQQPQEANEYLVDKILDKTGMKGTGKWTVQQAAELSVAAGTVAASLDARFLSGLKSERVEASEFYAKIGLGEPKPLEAVEKQQLMSDVRQALFASKICSYAQGMNIIKAKSLEEEWDIPLGELARIWKGGCIIRAGFLDQIKDAYQSNPELKNLLMDPNFANALVTRQSAWRRVVAMAVQSGVSVPGMSNSLAYFDSYRRHSLPANLVQAQRDFFGSHTYQRIDKPETEWFHTLWSDAQSADSITTSGYTN
uniref:6-phosphogluconate dehydrogenase, decarboxylating n=1 Tax=Chloropicon laureae TaxID=464258 RepID=A0A7S3E2N1_9CHLO